MKYSLNYLPFFLKNQKKFDNLKQRLKKILLNKEVNESFQTIIREIICVFNNTHTITVMPII